MDDEYEFLRPSKIYFLDTNLSSPVLDVELDATKKLLINHRNRILKNDASKHLSRFEQSELSFFRKLCSLRKWKSVDLIAAPRFTPELYPEAEKSMLVSPENFHSHYDTAASIAKLIEQSIADGLEQRGMPRSSIEGTADLLNRAETKSYRYAYEEFCNFYGRAEARTKFSEHTWTRGAIGNFQCWINNRYAIIELNGIIYHSSANQILMLKDKLATRFMMLEHVLPLRLGSDLQRHLLSLFRWQDETLESYGNDAYELLKAVEPMFKTRLSHITDDVFGEDTAYNRMQVKLLTKEAKILRGTAKAPSSMPALFALVESVQSLDHLVELFGCQKSCGHPIIDPSRGGLSAAAEARSLDSTSFSDAQGLRNVFCHIMLTSFIEKQGRWPPLTYREKGTKLELLNVRQERDISYSSYPLAEWTHTEWGKIFEMDYFPNYLELMDDKSISFYRSQKHLTWDEGNPTSQRRLLLELLRRANIDIKDIVERVSRRDIPWDWFIVSLYPKEREFKIDPRMFSMLVLEMRCFFTCIEANIADNVFKYLPQQTMTKTKTQIQERFLSFTDPSRDQNNHALFLEIDLSRWNLRWRELVIHMLGHDMNQMFGTAGTFTVTHWFFKKCQILVRVGGLRPDGIELDEPPVSSLAWRDHLGGFEGINQKLWTAATYAMVEKALIPLLLSGKISSYELIGQGDNQVLRLSIPKTDQPRSNHLTELRDTVNEQLEDTCSSVNQEVKPEENIESTTVLTYSKDVFIRGVEYPTTLKKHSRLFPVTSSDFPSTSAKASAIMAGVVAGAENSRHTLCSAVVGWYHTARYLLATSSGFSIHGKDSPKFSIAQVIAALILPPSIGGMIGTPIASFMYKGGSDPLGKEISSLRLIAESATLPGVIAGRALRGLEERYCFSPAANLEVLIDNPYGLPVDKQTSPLGQVSHLTLEAFKGKVVNKDIRPLLDRSVNDSEAKLKEDILAIRPLNPILAHDLFEASGFGTIKEMRKMFLNTRTVQSIAQWVNPNITHNFLRADINDILWFFRWLKGLPKLGYSGANSYTIVANSRSAWGVPLHGVTNYQPLDYRHSAGTVRSSSSIKWSAHVGQDLFYTRGPLTGYLGTATKDKRSEHGYKIVDAGASSRAMMKLQLIRSQANGNIAFNELLDRIGLTRTNCKLSWITEILDKVIGGSLSHRYASSVRTMSASYVGPLNFVTHIRLDTDSLGKVSGGSDNYSIMPQEFMVMSLFAAKLLYHHSSEGCGELLVPTETMTTIPDDALIASAPKFESASLPKSKLLYTPDLLLRRTYDNTARVIPRGSVVGVTSYSSSESIEEGFVGFYVDLLRDRSRGKVLADTRGASALPAKLQIDIAEAHAMGLIRLAKCMAKAIWISNLRDTFRTLHMHPERWDEALYLTHNISTCVRACSNYLRHPLCALHPDSDQLRGSSLRYGSSFSMHKRMEAKVKRYIVEIFQSVDNPFWSENVPVFANANSMSFAEALSISAIKRIYRMYIIGDRNAQQYSGLLASYSRLPTRRKMTPELQLEVLRARITQLAQVYYRMGDVMLSDEMIRAANLRYISVYNDSAQTVMRYARAISVAEGLPRPRVIRKPGVSPLHAKDICERCIPPAVTKHRAIWEKNMSRPNGGMASAGYTWAPILTTVRIMKQALIIGSGNGGLADLLLTAFDCEITGIDLEKDMPREAATLLNYVPVGVSANNSSGYTQSDLSISTSGDWYNQGVRDTILKSLSSSTTLFVDITIEGADHYPAIHDAMSCEMIDSMIFRFIGKEDSLFSLIALLNKHWSARSWLASRSHHSTECLVEVRCRKFEFLHSCSDPLPLHRYVDYTCHDLIPDRPSELLEAATLSIVSDQDLHSLTQVAKEVDSLCQSLLNKPKNRQLLYHDRISLIWAHITLTAAISDDPVSLIQDWIADEMVETSLFTYSVREPLLTHLFRYVPRLRARFAIA